jgi:virginiamycin B lyase
LWFAEIQAGRIGRISLDGRVTEFAIHEGSRPHAIVTGPDGALWFTQWGNNHIGRLTPAGDYAEFALPTPESEPHGIAAGPDGALWFALERGSIGRLFLK